MLLVKTKIGKSKIHGLGLFADQFIPKGTAIWKFKKGLDLSLTKKAFGRLPEIAKKTLKKYGYLTIRPKRWGLDFDDGRFINYSFNPNSRITLKVVDHGDTIVAVRNIKRGEEITNDYSEYDSQLKKMLRHRRGIRKSKLRKLSKIF